MNSVAEQRGMNSVAEQRGWRQGRREGPGGARTETPRWEGAGATALQRRRPQGLPCGGGGHLRVWWGGGGGRPARILLILSTGDDQV